MSSLNALPQLLSVRADKNKITSPKLQEVCWNWNICLLLIFVVCDSIAWNYWSFALYSCLLFVVFFKFLLCIFAHPLVVVCFVVCCSQMQYLQILSLAGNRLISTGGIAHPLLETLNLSCEYHVILPARHVTDNHSSQPIRLQSWPTSTTATSPVSGPSISTATNSRLLPGYSCRHYRNSTLPPIN